MRSFTSLVLVLGLLPAMGGCTDGGPSDPETTQRSALTATTAATTTAGRRPRSSKRTLDPTQTGLRPRPTVARSNVDQAIPFDRPPNPVVSIAPAATVASPGTVVPLLPLGTGPQRPASRIAAPVACAPAPALNLACPSDAPRPSTCTSSDNLPAGCHTMTAPGALYPDNAIPACCS